MDEKVKKYVAITAISAALVIPSAIFAPKEVTGAFVAAIIITYIIW